MPGMTSSGLSSMMNCLPRCTTLPSRPNGRMAPAQRAPARHSLSHRRADRPHGEPHAPLVGHLLQKATPICESLWDHCSQYRSNVILTSLSKCGLTCQYSAANKYLCRFPDDFSSTTDSCIRGLFKPRRTGTNLELTVTVKDDVKRLMQQTNSSPDAYREFTDSATNRASPWALLQAVQMGADAPTAMLHMSDVTPGPVPPPPEIGSASTAAPAQARVHSPRTMDTPSSSAVSPVSDTPERPQTAAANPFGRLFRSASPNDEVSRREQSEISLKSLLRDIGTCR